MPPQARLGDVHMCTTPVPGTPCPILPPCAVTVIVGKRPAARLGPDLTGLLPPPAVPPPHPFAKGSFTVLINNMPAIRIGDLCSLGGAVTLGEFTVITGG